jgi:hypothetical protein
LTEIPLGFEHAMEALAGMATLLYVLETGAGFGKAVSVLGRPNSLGSPSRQDAAAH